MMQWSRGYENLRTYVRFAFWLTHKRIVVTGLENIPKDKPVIFAANHQNALMDPLALVCTNPLQTLWLTRADIFKTKAVADFLKLLKMIPIYRIRDGKDNLSNNEEIFNQVTLTLESKQSVALFPEAAHSGRRQMLSHKKAIPRIAFETEEKNNFQLDLQVVPVGIFYDHYWKFNRTLLVQYGKPLEIDAFKDRYAENQQNAMLSLRDQIHERIEPLVMQINSVDHYADYEDIRMVSGKEYAKKTFFSSNPVVQLFKAEQELIAKIEKLEAGQPEVFKQAKDKTHLYIKTIRTTGITDKQLVKAVNTPLPLLLVQFIGALLTIPVFLFGLLTNAIPYLIPRLFITRKLKDKAFVSSFNFAVGLVLFPVFYLIEFGLIWVYSGSFPAALISIILMPFAGKAAFNLLLFYQDLLQVLRLKLVNRKLLLHCKNLRSDVIKTVEMYTSF
jgi:1-acyl-sn-glycerol-3-phosphate acyltransferase